MLKDLFQDLAGCLLIYVNALLSGFMMRNVFLKYFSSFYPCICSFPSCSIDLFCTFRARFTKPGKFRAYFL